MFLFGVLCAVASVVMLRYVVLPEGETGGSSRMEYQLPD
jgi:hypothetical protein